MSRSCFTGEERAIDIISDFLAELGPLGEAATERFQNAIVALPILGLRCRLRGVWQLRG